jgi:cytochrome c peroxidase
MNASRRQVFVGALGLALAALVSLFVNCDRRSFQPRDLDSSKESPLSETLRSLAAKGISTSLPQLGPQSYLKARLSNGIAAFTWDGRVAISVNLLPPPDMPSNALDIVMAGELSLDSPRSVRLRGMTLTMQGNGNAVLRDNAGSVRWTSNTEGRCSQCRLVFQENGNFLILNTSKNPEEPGYTVFNAGTNGPTDPQQRLKMFIFNSSPYLAIGTNGSAREPSKVLYPKSRVWQAGVFRAEKLAAADPNRVIASSIDDDSVETTLDGAFSPRYSWAVSKLTDTSLFKDGYSEVLQDLTILNIASLVPDPAVPENPYRSNISGEKQSTGAYLCYKAWMFTTRHGTDGTRSYLGLLPLTIVVRNPYSEQAEIQSIRSTARFQPLTDVSGTPLYGIEPTLTFDSKLLVFQNMSGSATGHLYYAYNQTAGGARGWTTPRQVTRMIDELELRKRYPMARYRMRDARGSAYDTLRGAYPWISLDGTDLFFTATANDDRARRAGQSAVGASTKGLIRLLDGGLNINRRGKIRTNINSLGRTPGRWSPLEFADSKVLPLTDKTFTYMLFSSANSQYFESSFEETMVGNYDLYLDMTEGLTRGGDYDTSVTQDASGHFHPGRLNSSAMFTEAAYAGWRSPAGCTPNPSLPPSKDPCKTCTDSYCPLKDPRDSLSNLFSGQPIYFRGDGAVTVPAASTAPDFNHVILQGARAMTVSFAVLPKMTPASALKVIEKNGTFQLHFSAGGILRATVLVADAGRTRSLSLALPSPLPSNQWSHVAMTYDTHNGALRLYLNGSLAAVRTFDSAGLPLVGGTRDVIVGPNGAGTSTIVYGLDQVGISRVVRSEAEIIRQANRVRTRGRLTLDPLPLGLKAKDVESEVLLTQRLNPARVALGKSLFFDPRLSMDNRVSCASCHSPAQGFAESIPLHDDRMTALGGPRRLLRNTPSLLNLGFKSLFFWDGRSPDLLDQAVKVTTNPHEMGRDINAIINKLKSSNHYQGLFRSAYPNLGDPITTSNFLEALRDFELSLASANSRFDRYMAGDLTALSTAERHGKDLFFGKARCAECHSGSAFTDNSFHRLPFLSPTNADGIEDSGRFRVTAADDDMNRFLTPSLRNLRDTGPYFHGGSAANIESVIANYMTAGNTASGDRDMDDDLAMIDLSGDEINNLASFVRTLAGTTPDVSAPSIPDIPPPLTDKVTKPPGTTLLAGQSLPLAHGTLAMQNDGNLVFYDANHVPLWNSGTAGQDCSRSVCKAEFKTSGNLVISVGSRTIFDTRTTDGNMKGSSLIISTQQPCLKILNSKGSIVWSSSLTFESLTLGTGQFVQIGPVSRQLKLIMQGDGNLVLYRGATVASNALWNSRTSGQNCTRGCGAIFQNDGNFVIYGNGAALWASGSNGPTGRKIQLSTAEPYIRVIEPNGSIVWSSSLTFESLALGAGQFVQIGPVSRQLKLIMQGDGNLVLYRGATVASNALWNSRTSGQNCTASIRSGGCRTMFGGALLRVMNGSASLRTYGDAERSGGRLLFSQTAPHIQILGANRKVVWRSP